MLRRFQQQWKWKRSTDKGSGMHLVLAGSTKTFLQQKHWETNLSLYLTTVLKGLSCSYGEISMKFNQYLWLALKWKMASRRACIQSSSLSWDLMLCLCVQLCHHFIKGIPVDWNLIWVNLFKEGKDHWKHSPGNMCIFFFLQGWEVHPLSVYYLNLLEMTGLHFQCCCYDQRGIKNICRDHIR